MIDEQAEWESGRAYVAQAERVAHDEVVAKAQAFLAAHSQVTGLCARVPDAESGRAELAFHVGDAYWCGEGEGVYLPDTDERVEGTHDLVLAALDLADYIRERSWVMTEAWTEFARV